MPKYDERIFYLGHPIVLAAVDSGIEFLEVPLRMVTKGVRISAELDAIFFPGGIMNFACPGMAFASGPLFR